MDLVQDRAVVSVRNRLGNPLWIPISRDSVAMYSMYGLSSVEVPFLEPLAAKLLDTFKTAMGDTGELHWDKVDPHYQQAWRRVAVCAIEQLLLLGVRRYIPFSVALPACKLGAEIRNADWPEGVVLVYAQGSVSTEHELLFKVDPLAQEKLEHEFQDKDKMRSYMLDMLVKSIPENEWEIVGNWKLPKDISFIDSGATHNTMTSGSAPTCL